MNLDEAIKHAEEVAKKDNDKLKIYELINEDRPFFIEEETECRLREDEYRQLAEWLKDYKRLLEQEHILEKIETEIKALFKEPAYYIPNYDAYKKVLGIIDKYKAEGSEE